MKKTETIKRAFSLRILNKGALLEIDAQQTRTIKEGRDVVSVEHMQYSVTAYASDKAARYDFNVAAVLQHEKSAAVALLQDLQAYMQRKEVQLLLALGAPAHDILLDRIAELSAPEKRALL